MKDYSVFGDCQKYVQKIIDIISRWVLSCVLLVSYNIIKSSTTTIICAWIIKFTVNTKPKSNDKNIC